MIAVSYLTTICRNSTMIDLSWVSIAAEKRMTLLSWIGRDPPSSTSRPHPIRRQAFSGMSKKRATFDSDTRTLDPS